MPSQLLLEEPPVSPAPKGGFQPVVTVFILAVVIFTAEIIAMVVLYFIDHPNYVQTTLLDGIIMTVLILPGLYLLQLRPLSKQIADRVKAEMALRENEKLLKKILELLPVGVWIIDKKGEIVHGNPESQKIWGGARYVGMQQYHEYKGWWAHSGEPIKSEDWAATRAISRGEIVLDDEIIIESFDGIRKAILNSAVPILDEERNLQGVIVVNQDITERKQMEQNIIQANELMEKIFFSIDTLIAYLDRDFNFLKVNETYAKSAAHSVDYFIGKNHFDLFPNAENEMIFKRVVETGEPFIVFEKPFEYAEYPERGVTYWDWSLQPVKGNNGLVEGLVFSLVDVTERKRAQIQLAERNQELLELTRVEHKQRELAESLVRSSIALSSSLNLNDVLDTILNQIHRAIPFTFGDICLLEKKTIHVVGYLSLGSHPQAIEAMKPKYSVDNFPLWRKAYTTRQPAFVENVADCPDWVLVDGMEWILSFAVAPLVVNDQVIGFINLSSDRVGAYNDGLSGLLLAFAVPAAMAIQNARLYMAESNARRVAETLRDAAQALTKTLDLDQVIDTLLEHIHIIASSDTAGVNLLEDETHLAELTLRGYGEFAGQESIPCIPIEAITDTVLHQVIASKKSILLPVMDLEALTGEKTNCQPIKNWLFVPIIASDQMIGLVELGTIDETKFDQELVDWVEAIVGQAAVAIQNAWLFQQVRSSSERLHSLARKLVEIQENERYHVARELHDEAGQSLSLLKIHLGLLEQAPDCTPYIHGKLEDLKKLVDGVMEELHRLAVDLRPIVLDHLGLVPALEQLTGSMGTDQLAVRFKAVGFDNKERLSKDVEVCLYRITQEALANTVRHAQAENVGVLLEKGDGRVKLFLEDDGIGLDPDLSKHKQRLGLVGMKERAEMVGGSLTIESTPGSGTSIIVDVPDANTNSNR